MASTETAINWFELRRGKVAYSMASRNGTASYDSSSAMYYALRAGELLEVENRVGNTDTLFDDLPKNGWSETDSAARGVVVLLGKKGSASGNAGVAAIFLDTTRVIHCSRQHGTIYIEAYSALRTRLGNPPAQMYRSSSSDSSTPTTLTNVGELEYLGIREGKVFAEGWHFSSDRPYEFIQFIDATTDAVIVTLPVTLTEREDIAEQYPEVPNIGLSGFEVSAEVPDGTSLYVKGIRSASSPIGDTFDELVFGKIITFERAYDVDTDLYAVYNEDMWFEILDGSSVLARGTHILSSISWETELMYVPSMTLNLPIEYAQYIEGRREVKVYVNHKVFHGLVIGHETPIGAGVITLYLNHVIHEWTYRQLSTNLAIKNQTVNDIYSTLDFRPTGWNIDYLQDSANSRIDYVYSRQDKLEGLTKTCELTPDLFWRVCFDFGRKVEIGSFGEHLPYTVSKKPLSKVNIPIVGEVTVTHEYDNVINVATVYGEKSDSGMSSLSLRDAYEGEQDPDFPIFILKNGINNERDYDYVEFTKLAPNNEIEYSILDLDSIDTESGTVIEGTFSFNDLSPFAVDGDEITDEDRAIAAQKAYEAGIKKLKNSRRNLSFEVPVASLPADVKVGDMLRFRFDWSEVQLGECSERVLEILNEDDWFYVTRITYDFTEELQERNTLTLNKFLMLDREVESQ